MWFTDMFIMTICISMLIEVPVTKINISNPSFFSPCVRKMSFLLYPLLQRSWKGGILVSPCPSVRLSVCGQNRVHSVSSTILIGSISYLHILSSNFRRCVACNVCYKAQWPFGSLGFSSGSYVKHMRPGFIKLCSKSFGIRLDSWVHLLESIVI